MANEYKCDGDYVLGQSARELERLSTQARFYEPFTMQFFRDAGIKAGMHVFCHNPSDTLGKLAGPVRPGGVIAFQEVDLTGCRSLPAAATFNRCARWIAESLEQSGADPYLGLKLYATFETAGVPAPALLVHAGIGAGPDHPLYPVVADLVRTLLPSLEELGLATRGNVDIETLTRRLSDEVVASSGTVVGPSLVGACSRKPEVTDRSPFSIDGGRTT